MIYSNNFEQIPVITTYIENHNSIKSKVLELIEECSTTTCLQSSNDSISKTDWAPEENNQSEYLDYVKPIIINEISKSFKKFGSNGLMFGNFWFQQYNENDIHDWHIHKFCHWTNIYFLELPYNDCKTEIRNFGSNSLISYTAKEGDVISFPSFLYHRSPKIANGRKTIISFNTNFI